MPPPSTLPRSAPSAATAWARALRDGDAGALRALYREGAGRAQALAVALLGGAQAEAEEVVQDAFLELWRRRATYDPRRASPLGWLLVLTRSKALSRLRARSCTEGHEGRFAHEAHAAAGGPWPPLALDAGADGARLERALDALPVEQRHVLELAYFRGLTQGDIARCTGAPLGTVKTRARLALRRLAQALRAVGGRGSGERA